MDYLGSIVEDLADKLGIYGPYPEGDHPDDCQCRICWISAMRDRLRRGVWNDLSPTNRHMIRLAFLSLCGKEGMTEVYRENVRDAAKALGFYDDELEAAIRM